MRLTELPLVDRTTWLAKLEDALGDGFIQMGVGRVIELEKD